MYVKFLYDKPNQAARLEKLCFDFLGPLGYTPSQFYNQKIIN